MSATTRLKRALRLTLLRLLERRLRRARFSASDVSLRKIKRILFVQQHDRLCDLLLSIPAFRAVRRAIPYAHIAVVARSPQAAVLMHEDCVDEVISFPPGSANWLFGCVRCFSGGLRSRFDLAIVLSTFCHSFTSDLLAKLSCARFVLGSDHLVFEGCRENFFYNLLAPHSRRLEHQVERGLDIVNYIGVKPAGCHTGLTFTSDESNNAIEYLLERGVKYREFVLGIHIDSGDAGCTWQIHRYVNVARHLSMKYGARIVVFWSGPGRERVQQFVDSLPFIPIEGSDLGLREQAALISCCNVFVCCDLDMMHLAAAAGVPLVGLFGDLDPHQWKPIGNRYLALKGALAQCLAIDESQVIQAVEMLAELYPKSVEISQREFDISEQVVDDYLGFGDISENIGGR